MISIFVMYSKDRAEAFKRTLACLRDMSSYQDCQKTLIVDGKIDSIPEEWEAIQVPRSDGKFCWGRMWDAGVLTSRFDKIIYLDSDRMLPTNYLEAVNDKLTDDLFVFTSTHFLLNQESTVETCKKILSLNSVEKMLRDIDLVDLVRYEVRHGQPYHGPGKNVMSGSTGFTKKTYLRLGGVDHWYRGHGAFADSDFHMTASCQGCQFYDLWMPELHFPHAKLDDKSNPLGDEMYYKLALDNFIYYCWKWDLPMTLAESLAVRSNVQRPALYINKRLKEIKADAMGS